jgi:hypothetical protein
MLFGCLSQAKSSTGDADGDLKAANSDGSPLMDLAGYTIYYRNESGGYSYDIRIDNPGLTTYVVDQLTPATYYFAATAFNASGIESSFSSEAVRMVN